MGSSLAYIRELRSRLLFCTLFFVSALGVAFYFGDELLRFVALPLVQSFGDVRFIYTSMAEAFMARVHVSVFVALCALLPVAFLQVYIFAAPALYSIERFVVACILLFIITLFFGGLFFCYEFIFPWACKFFGGFQYAEFGVHLMPRISEYVDFFVGCATAFGLAFQLPVVLILMMYYGIVDYAKLRKMRRVMVVLIFVLSAVLTPPDVLSQVALAIPLLIMYELSIVMGRAMSTRRLPTRVTCVRG